MNYYTKWDTLGYNTCPQVAVHCLSVQSPPVSNFLYSDFQRTFLAEICFYRQYGGLTQSIQNVRHTVMPENSRHELVCYINYWPVWN